MIPAVAQRKAVLEVSAPQPASRGASVAGRSETGTVRAEKRSFEDDLLRVVSRLRGEMAALLAALPEPVSGGADLKRQLGLANTASWQLYSFATAANPVTAVGQLPGRLAMTKLMHAAKRKGLDAGLIARVGEAFDEFDVFVKEHARDRATLDALASGLSQETGESAAGDLRWRRSAFRDNSHIWGLQARTNACCMIYHLGQPASTVDGVIISGYVGLHALRKNMPFRLMSLSGSYRPSDTEAAQKSLTAPKTEKILPEFSSRELPPMETFAGNNGMMETGLRFEGVGQASSVNVFTATISRDMCRGHPVEAKSWSGVSRGIGVPSEVCVVDMLVPRGLTNPSTVRTSTHGNVSMYESIFSRVPEFEMPVKEQAVYLGTSLRAMETPDVPRYVEMVKSVLGELKWAETVFDIFRVRVRYPIMHTLVHMRLDDINPQA